MKNIKVIIFILLTIGANNTIFAQSNQCSDSFVINTDITPSSCQSDGIITVSISGDTENISVFEYGLETYNNPGGFSKPFSSQNSWDDVPPGIYNVLVRALCSVNGEWGNVKTSAQVEVGGNYEVIKSEFNSSLSRKSYNNCNTGIIVINVTKGNGNFNFEIKEAPDNNLLGMVNASKNDNDYTLDGENYPPGAYRIEITDGCYSNSIQFTLNSISGYPRFLYTYLYFSPTPPYTSCSAISWNLIRSNINPITNGDYKRYFDDGMYEVSISIGDDVPTNWTTWNATDLDMDIAPRIYSDAYANNSLRLNIRVKGCTQYDTFKGNLGKTSATTSKINVADCDGVDYKIYALTGYNSFLCKPYSIKLKKENENDYLWEQTGIEHTDEIFTPKLEYNTRYNYTVIDANGLEIENRTIEYQIKPQLYDITNYCDSYHFQFNPPDVCFPHDVTISNKETGKVVYSGQITKKGKFPPFEEQDKFDYDTDYILTAVSTQNPSINYTSEFNAGGMNYSATSGLSPYRVEAACHEDYGYIAVQNDVKLTVRSTGGYTSFLSRWDPNTIVSVTNPQSGYTGNKYKTSGNSSPSNLPQVYLPAGTYTVQIKDGCGDPKEVFVDYNGGYDASALTYETEKTCEGMKITPKGLLKLAGNNVDTYYRITDGPPNYDKNRVIKADPDNPASFTFNSVTTSKYKIGIMFENSSTDCVLKEIEIDYDTESSVKLDQAKTAAYVCSGQTIGHILVAAIDGVAPYTYQLWDETGTNKLIENDIVSSGAARFNYGTAGTKYMIKITDNCKDAFNHVITMTKLEDVHIAYAPDGGVVCEGQTIQLRCVSLGETNYYWEGPNGWRANDVQYPMIPNAQSNMGGWYKVRVNPELCGEDVLDSIFITIADLPVAPTVNKTTLKYCLNEISQSLTQAAEISISSGNSLKCYAEDGTTEINPDELINTSTEGSFIFFVSQLSPSMCESARVQITVNIYLRPVELNNMSSAKACPGGLSSVSISSSLANHIYRIYDAATDGNLIAEVPGTGGTIEMSFTVPAQATNYYIDVENENGCKTASRAVITIDVYDRATAANIIINDASVCPNGQAELEASADNVNNPTFIWYPSRNSTQELARGTEYTTPPISKNTTYYVSVSGTEVCENLPEDRKEVTVSILNTPKEYRHIRISACPANPINLTKYVNKEHFKSITWSPADLFNNNGINDGILKNAEELIPGHTYTYRYDITNTCNSASGLLFLTSFKDKNVNPKNAEIKICYENASDIQLNDILGIEASGSWSCLTGNASAYLKTNLPAPHAGLAVFDGKSAWEDDSIPYDSNNNKIITIDYTTSADSCIGEKTATITIILTPDLT